MPTIDVVETGKNIQMMRKQTGISVKDIQQACGLASGNAVYKWIHGECMPTIDNIVILAHMMNTTIDKIIITKIV